MPAAIVLTVSCRKYTKHAVGILNYLCVGVDL